MYLDVFCLSEGRRKNSEIRKEKKRKSSKNWSFSTVASERRKYLVLTKSIGTDDLKDKTSSWVNLKISGLDCKK